MDQTPVLIDEEIVLTPFTEGDYEYLFKLAQAYPYNAITNKEEAVDVAHKQCVHIWRVTAAGVDSGVVTLNRWKDFMTLDAYIDPSRGRGPENFDGAVRTGKLVEEFHRVRYDGPLYIYFDARAKMTRILTEALGFIYMKDVNHDGVEYNLYGTKQSAR
jgi:hypothetical protein